MRIASKPVSRTNLLTAAAFAALAVTGCADVSDAEQNDTAEQTEVTEVKSTEQALQSGPVFAEVVANGTGCPPGSTEKSVSSDGKALTLTFSKYFVEFTSKVPSAIPGCVISVKMHTPPGLSYALSEFLFTGYATLPTNSSAKLSAAYSYQGNATVALDSSKKTLTGPYDNSYTFRDLVRTQDLTWSPCGVTRDLNIRTTLSVSNPGRGDGSIVLSALDANLPQSGLIVKFASRPCK